MQELIARQKEIIDNIHKIHSNFNKDSASRKTDSYIKKRISSLDSLWAEFDINHTQLLQSGDDYSGQEYFKKDVFKDTQRLYERIKGLIQNFNPSVEEELNPLTQARPALSDLMSEQKTNFRALQRLINSIDITKIVEKWELEDELRRLQSRWRDIDNLHLKIDNISQGEDETYEQEFSVYEKKYKDTRRVLNRKISSTAHQYEATPKMDVTTFHGDYVQWPTFLDLYKSSIHDNPTLTNAQKMQHLKGKLKREAHRLIQHLNVSSDNYETAWNLLFHRYNNLQVLFTKHIELFLNQRTIEKQTSNEIIQPVQVAYHR